MSKGSRNKKKRRLKSLTKEPSSPQQQVQPIGLPPEPGSQQWSLAQGIVSNYQLTIDEIRSGRKEAGFRINDLWNDWYNNLMSTSFTLGGALVAVASVVKLSNTGKILFWVGDVALIANGLLILFWRKKIFEKESTELVNMGYEHEYYAMIAKNRVLEYLGGKPFNSKEYEEAKEKLVSTALQGIDRAYDESRSIDRKMDIAVATFTGALIIIAASAIYDNRVLVRFAIAGGCAWLILLKTLKSTDKGPKSAIKDRDQWLAKIDKERNDHLN